MAKTTTEVNSGEGFAEQFADGTLPRSEQTLDEIRADKDAQRDELDAELFDPEASPDARAYQKKLSPAQMGCLPELVKTLKDADEMAIFRVIASFNDLTGPKELPNAKPGQNNITFGLVGDIEATNLQTGEIFLANEFYFPEGFHDMHLRAMEQQLQIARANGATAKVHVAWEFYAFKAANPRGYSWRAKSLLPAAKHDPLASLRRRALAVSTVKMLPAPQTASQPAA